MKKAIFVVGAESSGSRMLTQAFISVGCFGDGGHRQRLDRMDLSKAPDNIVWRRSVPHGESWPKFNLLFEKARKHNYEIIPIVIFRDKAINARSQKRWGHAHSLQAAQKKVERAINHINLHVQNYKSVSYEQFVTDPEYRKQFFAELGFPPPKMKFYNANNRYSPARNSSDKPSWQDQHYHKP